MNDSVHACAFDPATRSLSVLSTTMPEPGPREAVAQVLSCTVCGSDLHTYRGRRTAESPVVLGHEIAGRLVALGDPPPTAWDGTPLHVGQRVVWSLCVACGTCSSCCRGWPQKCGQLFKYGHTPCDRQLLSGGFAEACHLIAGTQIVPLPTTVSDSSAPMAACATATCFAAHRQAGSFAGGSVAVLGAGMLGLNMIALAHQAQAARVVVAERDAERSRRAETIGARVEVRSGVDAVRFLAREVDSDRESLGFDHVFEMTGQAEVIRSAADLLRVGGTLTLVGSVLPTPPLQLDPELVVRRLLRIQGVHNYQPSDLAAAISFLGEQPQLQASVGPWFSGLNDVGQALQAAESPQFVRVGWRPHE